MLSVYDICVCDGPECVMCGPTLVLRRDQKAGDHVFCHACTGDYAVEQQGSQLVTTFTGRKATPQDLEPAADTVLIADVVRESARALLV